VRGAADAHAPAFDFLLENGWVHLDDSTLRGGGGTDSVNRTITTDPEGWTDPPVSSTAGIGLTRPLEVSARNKGVQFIMNHHMDKLYREGGSGRVVASRPAIRLGYPLGTDTPLVDVLPTATSNRPRPLRSRRNKAVLIATVAARATGNSTRSSTRGTAQSMPWA